MKIAFVGLGNMGLPMAARLIGAGHEVRGCDASAAAGAAATARGVPVAALPEAVRGAEAVVTMLPNGEAVRAVWGALAEVPLVIDCSTIDVESARAAHAMLPGRLTLDAPVSGGTAGAEAGTLTFMAGGGDAAFAAAAPVLAPMAGRVVHCGAAGAGQAAKICNNMILGATMIATCEAFVLAERLGLSHRALFDVASVSSGQSWSLTSYCPVPGPVPGSPANRGYAPGFAAALMLKDLLLAQQAARETGTDTPIGAEAARLYARFAESGGGRDFSAIIEALRG